MNKLFPIGIGTWGIGGFAERDKSINESKHVEAIAYMFNKGMNFVEANCWYSEGYSVEILAKALEKSTKKREDIFICQAVYLKDGDLSDIELEVNRVLKLFKTDYVDTIQFTKSVFDRFGFEESCMIVDKLLLDSKSRYTSITNENLELLKKYHLRFGKKLFSHEVCYNLEIRANQDVIDYASKNNIISSIYQPLRRNRTSSRNWPILVELAKKYGKSQNQILMAWLVGRGYLPLTKSETISHIDEHLESLKIKLDAKDMNKLNSFSPPGYKPPMVDWNKSGVGVAVDQLSNVFDEDYDKQMSV